MPGAYVSGTPISNSSTFSGRTIAGLGLTNGATRTFTLPSGDTIVLNVGPPIPPVATATAPIPTLSDYALVGLILLMAMIGIAAVRRGRTGN
ncbi:MAG: IPTL-CTERM sorting domain-containing protein [Acidovorax sp.]|uniref:IPTL-CTERM sorting domain-containing protein n=1 Tax=Acidovorax sp. TaxID=1872122 RepID=UPI00391B9C78